MNNVLVLTPPISIKYRLVLNYKLFWVLTLTLLFLFSAIYIFQINSLASQIYTLKNYEKKITQLSQENKILEINFSKVNSLNNLETYLSNQNFEKVSQVKYIRMRETEIAKNK